MPSNPFDALIDKVDSVHQKTFAVDVLIDGNEARGVFDEDFDEFEGGSTTIITLEIPMSDLPEGTRKGSLVELVDSGRTFKVTRPIQRDKLMTLIMT